MLQSTFSRHYRYTHTFGACAAVATKWRRGGSLPVLVGSALTLPLAHTIHSTSRAVPPAVVSVAGAHGAARKCGCTPQVEGGRRLAHVRLEKWLHRHGAHKTSIRAAPGHHTHRQIPCGNSTAARSTNGCCSQHFYVKSAVHKPIVPTALTHVSGRIMGGCWAATESGRVVATHPDVRSTAPQL